MSGKVRVRSNKRVRDLALKSLESSRVTGGRDKSQANHSEMVVVKLVDKATPKLLMEAL